MAIRILVDTNVILDYILKREPWQENARQIILACKQKQVIGCVAAHSISNMFFILRKAYNEQERKLILRDVCKLFEIEGIDKNKLLEALDNKNFKDFEDCLQMECAKAFQADYIVSRNISDFENSDIPCVMPEKICTILSR